MPLPRDLFNSQLSATFEAARLAAEPFVAMRRESALMRAAAGLDDAGLNARENALALAAAGMGPFHQRDDRLSILLRAQSDPDRLYRAAFPSAFIDRAEHIAHLASGYTLPDVLERFRTPTDDFVDRILRASNAGLGATAFGFSERPQIEAFTRASAMADMFAETDV